MEFIPQKVVEAKTLFDLKKKLDIALGAKGIEGYGGKGDQNIHRIPTVQKEAIWPIESAPTTIPPRPYPHNPTYLPH